MKAKFIVLLGIACLAAAGCGQSCAGDQDIKPKTTVQSAAADPRIPPEKQAEIQRIMAQQQAPHPTPSGPH